MGDFLGFLGVMVSIGLALTIPLGAILLFKSLAARAERTAGSGDRDIDAGTRPELEDLRSRLDELERLQARVEELEERMDFSERILTRDKSAGQLNP
jgi:uncharacterized protein YlxW (UPF0749 family)